MGLLVVRDSSIAEFEAAPNIWELLQLYADESAVKGLPSPSAKAELYKQLESTGALHSIGAFLGDELVGFITVLSAKLPHYGNLVSVAESFFVTKEHRKTGAGLRLLRSAEEHAKSVGSPGLLVSAPVGGDLAEVMPGVGYTESSRVFFKAL